MKNFYNLKIGSLVRHKSDNSKTYIITEDFGTRFTGVRTVDITNPIEWDEVKVNP